jgi:hypothetical protein
VALAAAIGKREGRTDPSAVWPVRNHLAHSPENRPFASSNAICATELCRWSQHRCVRRSTTSPAALQSATRSFFGARKSSGILPSSLSVYAASIRFSIDDLSDNLRWNLKTSTVHRFGLLIRVDAAAAQIETREVACKATAGSCSPSRRGSTIIPENRVRRTTSSESAFPFGAKRSTWLTTSYRDLSA